MYLREITHSENQLFLLYRINNACCPLCNAICEQTEKGYIKELDAHKEYCFCGTFYKTYKGQNIAAICQLGDNRFLFNYCLNYFYYKNSSLDYRGVWTEIPRWVSDYIKLARKISVTEIMS
jgi:hypothetical protein